MCGIFGFTGPGSENVLTRMGDAIRHRGPDDAGYWQGSDVSLGMRRLSIIDLATGQQPMSNEDGTLQVVFNGEIYNHRELRRELEAKGHRFRTDHSDTEVIPHLYEEYGPDYVNRLNGMFAIAIWDGPRRELHLARDHSGIKPLFFSASGGRLVFGSEIKSILLHPRVSKAPCFKAIHHYFTLKNIPAPWSAFEGIEQLRPGERLVFKNGEARRFRWWRFEMRENEDVSEAEAASHIRGLLEDSVRLRMDSDVPFGAYLSGGLDSSSVVALMSRLSSSSNKVKTFTLAYEDGFAYKNVDQVSARKVSELYGTEHYEHVMSHAELSETLDAVMDSFDEPFSGVTSTYFITRLISKHVKVALSGDGADELFGSYLSHRLATPLRYFPVLKDHLNRLTAQEKALLEPYLDRPEYLSSFIARGDEAAQRMGMYLADEPAKKSLYTPRMSDLIGASDTEKLIRETLRECRSEDPLNRALYLDFVTLLPDQVLAFVDRLSMAHSVEVRPPFLDHRLIEYAAHLPGRLKMKGGRSKSILKEAVKDLLPAELINRPKEGFVLPVNDWLLSSLQPTVEKILSREKIEKQGLLRFEEIKRLLDNYYSGQSNQGARIWNLMMFQAWWDRHFGE